MDPPSQDISPVDDLVIIDSQTGLRFKRSSGSRLQQNSVTFWIPSVEKNSTFNNTDFSLFTYRPLKHQQDL